MPFLHTNVVMPRSWIILAGIALSAGAGSLARAEHFAVLVAAPRCADRGWPTLRFAEQDVARLAEVLERSGYRDDRISLLKPTQPDKKLSPTRSSILAEFDRVAAAADEDDTLVFVLSGHGVERSSTSSLSPFFCPADGDPSKPESMLSLGDIVAAVKSTRASSVVLLVDACRTFPKATSAARDDETTSPKLPPRWFVLWSCSAGESAFEDPKLQHGVFPHWVIEGLRGSADASDDRRVSATELAAFAAERTSRYVHDRLKKPQHPEKFGDGDAVLVELP